jgi:predicted kinase
MELTKAKAKKLYPESPDWFKNELEEKFGKETFVENNFEKIKTVEDACRATGVKLEDVISDKDTPDEVAYKTLKIVRNAVTKNWIPDWNNSNQEKWFPVFKLSSGFGFSTSAYSYACARTYVGSRLCFETEEQSNYVANQFINLYKDLLTITQ